MGLLEKLKSALGLDGERSAGSGGSSTGDTGVTVEREPSTESENAVKGTEASASGTTVGNGSDAGDEPAAAPATGSADAESETDADADDGPTGSGADIVQDVESDAGETDAGSESDADAEPESTAETGAESGDGAGAEAAESDAESETDAEPESDSGADEAADSPPVTEINGIGPAYGDRLHNVGVETVAELAAADAAELASQTDLSETRISGWIEQAEEF